MSTQTLVVYKLGVGGDERLKSQKLFFLNRSIDNPKLCNISENQPSRSIRRGEMMIFPFWILQNGHFSSISPPN